MAGSAEPRKAEPSGIARRRGCGMRKARTGSDPLRLDGSRIRGTGHRRPDAGPGLPLAGALATNRAMTGPAALADGDSVLLADEAATDRLARALAPLLAPGDVIALSGELGAGKTRFARALIGALAGAGEEVPSPTFTLVQSYDTPRGTLRHFDLYRLTLPEEAYELGIEEAFAEDISVIEWPERLGRLLPAERLEIALGFGREPTHRTARLLPHGRWRERLAGFGFHG
jgi:tRNA threonylcarbamoyladenosine biosynthesis protein TsaE